MGATIWSPLNTEPWCTVFCRLFDMAPHLGTFLILMKVSEKFKKMCLPWPRRWAGPCYRMPRYYIHETIRLFLVLLVFYQVWFQFWFAVSLVLTVGYGYPEHRIKRNLIPALMLIVGVSFYVVCWCGLFGRKQDGSFAAAKRGDRDRAKHQDDAADSVKNSAANHNAIAGGVWNNNNNVEGSDETMPLELLGGTAIRHRHNPTVDAALDSALLPPSPPAPPASRVASSSFQGAGPLYVQSLPNIANSASNDFSDEE